MIEKEYTDDIFKAQFATYNRLFSIVELLEPIVGMRGGMYWICKDRDDKLIICEESDLSEFFKIQDD